MLTRALSAVLEGGTLTQAEMAECMTAILSGATAPTQVAALLGALRVRGETVDELAGAATAVRAMATRVVLEQDVVVDTCGTGGDARGTFNISTAAAIVASACGVTVAKHGNRSVSSKCGSADVLEALGVRFDLTPEAQARLIAHTRLGFLFAPAHHPAFRHVAALRRELGVRTLFNLVGPLANPAGAKRQVLGVFDASLVSLMAQVLAKLGTEHALVVHGDGLDEISVCGETHIVEVHDGVLKEWTITPEALGLSTSSMNELRGGDAAHNARMLKDILEGQRGAPRDAVLANAAAAQLVAGQVANLREGVERAQRVIDSGAADAHFERFLRLQHQPTTTLDEIVAKISVTSKPPAPSAPAHGLFRSALSSRGGPKRIIAEVKRRSPSAGNIATISDPAALAQQYVAQGAAAISVLTNTSHFGGSLSDLSAVRAAVAVPVLRKEFVAHPGQCDEAAEVGAHAVLLIAAVLGKGLGRMLRYARSLGLDALVEVHDERELQLALESEATIIGVNNRDLRTFEVDLGVSERLVQLVPPDVVFVAESGIRSDADLERLRAAGISNFLVGEFLVRGGRLQ